jgi:hypothetical protein
MATLERAGKPPHSLCGIDVPTEGDLDLGDIVVAPGVRLRALPEGRDAVPRDLRLELVREQGGRAFGLPRGDDGAFVSDGLVRGNYSLRGSSSTHFVPPLAIAVGDAEPVLGFRCEPAPTLRVEWLLGDDERSQIGWSGTLTLRRGADVVVSRRYEPRFRGCVPTPLLLGIAAPPGAYTVELEPFDGVRRATCELAPTGTTLSLPR